MTGAVVELDHADWARFQKVLDRLIDARPRDLLEQLVGGVEQQTRKRIADTKEAPSGAPWPKWSPGYAKTRHAGQSLLQGEGDLLDSITGETHDEHGEVGSNLIYAPTQNYGDPDRGIPARRYLGVSRENLYALESLTEHWAEALLQ
ncbi:phage virion morphogenesis protein [Salinisphaera hydrothermalis]|uniref:phage virion morphogenesis protein n=1 Tax=Salinisphaera hydrothermalis TaxID=563188 RepID=UPI00334002B2